MDRRTFVSTLACGLITPIAAFAQPGKLWRIGELNNRPGSGPNEEAFFAGMRELGYIEQQDFAMEDRWGAGHEDRLPAFAAGLVALTP